MKALKTPLRYPGGKSRACTKMDQYFPELRNYTEFREPFLGGGSVAIHVSKKYPHLKITVNDLYEPLINFWTQLQQFGGELTEVIKNYKSTHKVYNLKAYLYSKPSKRYKTKKFLLAFQREVHQKVTSHIGLNMLRKFILKKSCN